jgi:hypothetical protein
MYKIRCTVSGGVTGYRSSILKTASGAVREFETRKDAEAVAKRLNEQMNHANSVASFSYAVEVDDDEDEDRAAIDPLNTRGVNEGRAE